MAEPLLILGDELCVCVNVLKVGSIFKEKNIHMTLKSASISTFSGLPLLERNRDRLDLCWCTTKMQ